MVLALLRGTGTISLISSFYLLGYVAQRLKMKIYTVPSTKNHLERKEHFSWKENGSQIETDVGAAIRHKDSQRW